jgi:hypothetical protein
VVQEEHDGVVNAVIASLPDGDVRATLTTARAAGESFVVFAAEASPHSARLSGRRG